MINNNKNFIKQIQIVLISTIKNEYDSEGAVYCTINLISNS